MQSSYFSYYITLNDVPVDKVRTFQLNIEEYYITKKWLKLMKQDYNINQIDFCVVLLLP